jgi:transcriptional regulator with XRE-family HTH domain
VNDMQETQSWRALLGEIISNTKERQRLAEELGVQPITLNRWVNGDSEPRPQNLRHLLSVLPQHREQLLTLIKQEKGLEDFPNNFEEDTLAEIPSQFYAKVLVSLASSTDNLRFWSISEMILQQALEQLDPDHQGMAVRVATCMPPSGPKNQVRSLRERIGRGTSPWSGNLEQKGMFLGAESLAGNVVTLCRPSIIENIDEEHNLPAVREEYEKSCAVFPILYAGRIAGAFIASSTQYNYFQPSSRTALVQCFTDLIALAFEPEDFYAPEQIALGVMPDASVQKRYFVHFRSLLLETVLMAARNGSPLDSAQADLIVWKRLEEKLLRIHAQDEPKDMLEAID